MSRRGYVCAAFRELNAVWFKDPDGNILKAGRPTPAIKAGCLLSWGQDEFERSGGVGCLLGAADADSVADKE